MKFALVKIVFVLAYKLVLKDNVNVQKMLARRMKRAMTKVFVVAVLTSFNVMHTKDVVIVVVNVIKISA